MITRSLLSIALKYHREEEAPPELTVTRVNVAIIGSF